MSDASSYSNRAVGLDIGSNTFSCAEIQKDGDKIAVLDDASLPVRLSEGLRSGGRLKPEALDRAKAALDQLVKDFDLPNKPVRAVATAVLRKTGFPEEFIIPAEKIIGHPIEVIPGEEEARLTCLGAITGIAPSDRWVIMDVGGQSTEVGRKQPDGEWRGVSLDFGVVSLTERFVHHDPPLQEELDAISAEVRNILREALPVDLEGDLLGVAGTATTLGMLAIGTTTWAREKVHGLTMSLDDVVYWKNTISACTAKERTDRHGVRPLRADVFPSGICITEEMIRFLNGTAFTISANGLRVGVALSRIG